MNHYVYLTTNLVNNKKYVGKHSTDKTIEDDTYLGSGVLISKAISKYGAKNFKREILHICSSEEEAFALEIKEIEERNAVESDMYYNLSAGGDGNSSGSITAPGDFKKHPEIYNPRKYISEINKDFNKAKGRTYYKLKYYCAYLRFNDYPKQITKKILIELSKKSLDKYLLIQEFRDDFVQELVEQVYSLSETQISDFIGNTKIDFYKSELELICSMEQERLRKIAFGTFVYYKLKSNDNNDYISFNHSAICQLGKLSIKKSERDELLERLSKIGCIDICEKNYRIPYCKNGDKSDIYKTISSYTIDENFYLLLEEYKGNKRISNCKKCGSFIVNNKYGNRKYCECCSKYNLHGYKIIKCADCGKSFVTTSRNSRGKRCDSCRHEKQLEYQRNSMKKQREMFIAQI